MESEDDLTVSGISKNLAQAIQNDEALSKGKPHYSQKLTKGKKIGISISDSEELPMLGFSQVHMQDVMCEFARYFLAYGATLVYGGDLRQNGYTITLSELAKLYSNREDRSENRIINYLAWPVHLQLTRGLELEWKYKFKLVKLPPPPGVQVNQNQFITPELIENRFLWCRSLTLMRKELAETCDYRIVMGGTLSNFIGSMPGILEEVLLTIQNGKPLYLIGAFGGVTKAIINCIQGLQLDELTEEHIIKNSANKGYEDLLRYIRKKEHNHDINYDSIQSELINFGINGLSKANGLTEEENKRLFITPHFTEMIFLVLKGVKKIS